MTTQITQADLYEALKQADPQAFYSSGMFGTKRWVLSTATVREIAALQLASATRGNRQGEAVAGDQTFTEGYLLGLPYRVDDAAEGLTFEDDPT